MAVRQLKVVEIFFQESRVNFFLGEWRDFSKTTHMGRHIDCNTIVYAMQLLPQNVLNAH